MNKSLLYVTVGPVQSFIEQARKTQDLYIGSLILSHLSRTGMNFVQHEYKGKIIFPNPNTESVPNRFVAGILTDRSLDEIGFAVERHIREEFIRIGKSLLHQKKFPFSQFVSESLEASYIKQLETHLQVYWVAIPFEDYARTYTKLEALMGQVKNVRKFQQIEEKGRKCNLTGEHNVLFYRNPRVALEGKRKFFIPEEAVPLDGDVYLSYIQDGEYLGALGFLKRFAFSDVAFEKIKIQFPSTSKIAMLHLLNKDEINNPYIDCSYVLERLNGQDPTSEVTEKQKEESEKLVYRLTEENALISPYYAIMIFDGDSMGKWFGGEYLVHIEELESFQQSFTDYLGEYAKWAKTYLVEPRGKTVYAGGDDFFGFINLHFLFEVIAELRKQFDKQVNQKLQKEFELKAQLTFTAGICIGHYKEPLADIVNGARAAEKFGKKVEQKEIEEQDKDAFCISIMKRSGERLASVYKWKNKEDCDIPCLLIEILSMMTKYFSNTFIQAIEREFLMFNSIPADDMLKAELQRLLHRALKEEYKGQKCKVDTMVDLLMKLWNVSGYVPYSEKEFLGKLHTQEIISNFINTLHILSFLKRFRKEIKNEERDELCKS